jgi:hypothetical protein
LQYNYQKKTEIIINEIFKKFKTTSIKRNVVMGTCISGRALGQHASEDLGSKEHHKKT